MKELYDTPLYQKTKREACFFNTTSLCNLVDHYMLSSVDRLIDTHLFCYIKDNLYWDLWSFTRGIKWWRIYRAVNTGGTWAYGFILRIQYNVYERQSLEIIKAKGLEQTDILLYLTSGLKPRKRFRTKAVHRNWK